MKPIQMFISSLFCVMAFSKNSALKSSHLLMIQTVPTHSKALKASHQWRLFNVEVPLNHDSGKDDFAVNDALLNAVSSRFELSSAECNIAVSDVSIVKKSFDGRWRKDGQPKFVYTVDVNLKVPYPKLQRKEGKMEPAPVQPVKSKLNDNVELKGHDKSPMVKNGALPRVIVIGTGPAGLFAALTLAEEGFCPLILERGQPVESRGRDIGALIVRNILNSESNLCYGEGGAGTWSDGKLTTRIGKNSEDVRAVLEELVAHGAPEHILFDGKPHLGTDRLVRILKVMRAHLESLGATYRFGTRVKDVVIKGGKVTGVELANGDVLLADIVVLAIGHSARPMYERLLHSGLHLESKGIAVGFRVEHPQELINSIQYGPFSSKVLNGKGPVPVADYKLAASNVGNEKNRNVYSFCMCPGGQIVPTSVIPEEVCVNGMSFSNRSSRWANSALVVGITPQDMVDIGGTGPLRGVYWQQEMERRAAKAGGGNLVVPVQTIPNFLQNLMDKPENIPTSSYRLGVRPADLHQLYPPSVISALSEALLQFEKRLPGFICKEGLLHGVETRTSAPVQITRNSETMQCVNAQGLYPAGEGAGYAGGIVSAAVDGTKVGRAIIDAVKAAQKSIQSSSTSASGTNLI